MAKSKRRGGRRKGAGRPRSSPAGKTDVFSTRIDAGTRAWLDAESERTGLTVSSFIAKLFRSEMQKQEKSDQAGPTRALCYVIGLLAERISGLYFAKPEYNWRSNPFMFEAFRTAVLSILDEMRPPGEIVTPPPLHSTFKSLFKENPDEHGLEVARALIFQLQLEAFPSLVSSIPEEKRPPEWNIYTLSRRGLSVDQFTDALSYQQHGLADAGQALLSAKESNK